MTSTTTGASAWDAFHSTPPRQNALTVRGLVKEFGTDRTKVTAVNGIDLDIRAARFTAIMGPSGSGKSTLMHCCAGLERPTRGRVWVGSQEVTGLGDAKLAEMRRVHVGFIFQSFNLLPTLTARENILLPLRLSGATAPDAWFRTVVDAVGLHSRLDHRPGELSGGQQQRVATARALIAKPTVIFADEPTGALDTATGTQLLDFLRTSVDEFAQSLVMVTHDDDAAARADRVITMVDGQVATDDH
mgnify:CR=1 FL=1